jgi:hypothetical protein
MRQYIELFVAHSTTHTTTIQASLLVTHTLALHTPLLFFSLHSLPFSTLYSPFPLENSLFYSRNINPNLNLGFFWVLLIQTVHSIFVTLLSLVDSTRYL